MFTAILVFLLVLAPVLVPATISACHALVGLRRRRAARFARGYAVQPIPASA